MSRHRGSTHSTRLPSARLLDAGAAIGRTLLQLRGDVHTCTDSTGTAQSPVTNRHRSPLALSPMPQPQARASPPPSASFAHHDARHHARQELNRNRSHPRATERPLRRHLVLHCDAPNHKRAQQSDPSQAVIRMHPGHRANPQPSQSTQRSRHNPAPQVCLPTTPHDNRHGSHR